MRGVLLALAIGALAALCVAVAMLKVAR